MPRLPPVAVVDRGRIAGILDAANALADQAPFRPRDGAGRRMAAAIRSVIQRIDVANTGFAEFEATVTLRVSPFLDLDIGAEPAGDAYVIKAETRPPVDTRQRSVAGSMGAPGTGRFSRSRTRTGKPSRTCCRQPTSIGAGVRPA